MRRLSVVVLLILVCGLVGCASAFLKKGATTEEQRAALCMDAASGLAMANAALSASPLSADMQGYWTAFQNGAQIGIATYCGGGAK